MGCRYSPAWGAYRKDAYSKSSQTMKNLVCCDGQFACSPYQPNQGAGCSYQSACPTLGAGDPDSKFHRSMAGKDLAYPQENQDIRFSSSFPDWPLTTTHQNYAAIYKGSSPTAYS